MDEHDEFHLEVSDLRSESASQSAHRRGRLRVVGGVVAVLLIVLALAVILGSTPAARQVIARALSTATPQPTAPLAFGADTLLLEHMAPWARVRVDGGVPSRAFVSEGITELALQGGRHAIEVDQVPFPPLRCMASIPAAHDDTCPLVVAGALYPPNVPPKVRVIDVGAQVDRLPDEAFSALVAAVGAAIPAAFPPTQIRPDEHYLDAEGRVAEAKEILTATLIATVDASRAPQTGGDLDCRLALCTIDGLEPDTVAWELEASVTWHWRIARGADGTVVADAPVAPVGPSFASVPHATLLQLTATWNGSWHAAVARDREHTVCTLALAVAQAAAVSAGKALFFANSSVRPAIGTTGCLVLAVRLGDVEATEAPQAYFLYRFGALLAANDLAHRLLPSAPVASASEHDFAASLAS